MTETVNVNLFKPGNINLFYDKIKLFKVRSQRDNY